MKATATLPSYTAFHQVWKAYNENPRRLDHSRNVLLTWDAVTPALCIEFYPGDEVEGYRTMNKVTSFLEDVLGLGSFEMRLRS